MLKIKLLLLSMLVATGGLAGCSTTTSTGKPSTCPGGILVHYGTQATRLSGCAGQVGLTPLPVITAVNGKTLTITGLAPKAYIAPTTSDPTVVKVTTDTPTTATLQTGHAGTAAVMRLNTAYCAFKPQQQSACPVLIVRVVPLVSTCALGAIAVALTKTVLVERLGGCSGGLDAATPPTMTVPVGTPITVAGLGAAGAGFGDPSSSDPSVLKVTYTGATDAALVAERVGTAVVGMDVYNCYVPGRGTEHQTACPALIVHGVAPTSG